MRQNFPSSSRAAWVAGIGGGIAALIGLLTIIGWHGGFPWLVQWQTGLPLMAYFTALGLTLTGLGLLAYALGWPRLFTFACGVLVGLFGWAWCLERLIGWPQGILEMESRFPVLAGFPPIQSSLGGAASMGLFGVALASLGARLPRTLTRAIVWVAGSLALAAYATVLGAYVTGFIQIHDLRSPSGLAINTLAAMMAVGLGLLAALLMDGRRILDDPLLPLPTVVMVAAASVILWAALRTEHRHAAQDRAGALAHEIASTSLSYLNPSLRALERMKLRWEQEGGTPQNEWEADADAHLQPDRNFLTIQRADASWKVVWSRPAESANQWIGRDLREDPRWESARSLTQGFQSHGSVVSRVLPLPDGTRAMAAYFPLFSKGVFDGWMVGLIPFDELTRSVMQNAKQADVSVSVFEDDRLIFDLPSAISHPMISGESKLNFFGHHWRFVVGINSSAVVGYNLATIILILGLLLAVSLGLAVRAFQQVAWKSREVQIVNRRLERYANEDYLTGLWNRRYFDEVLTAEVKRAQRGRRGLSVLMADVDYFKRYNDRYGHQAGDECLRQVAAVLHNAGRASDSMGRYGGEEFCAVLPDTDAVGALELAERIRAAVQALALPHELNPPGGVVTASFGVASVDFSSNGSGDLSAEKLIARADAALYRAKESGRNQVCGAD